MPNEFKSMTRKFVKKIFPKYYEHATFSKQRSFKEYEDIFAHFTTIAKNKEIYDLHWALDETKLKFSKLYGTILSQQITPNITKLKSKIRDDSKLKFLEKLNYEEKLNTIAKNKFKLIKSKTEQFKFLSYFISILDIIISVVLILAISALSHYTQNLISSYILGTLFIAFVALLKVTLDRFWLIPKIKKFGWRKYGEAVKNFEITLAELEAVALVVKASMDAKDDPQKTLNLLQRGIENIRKVKY